MVSLAIEGGRPSRSGLPNALVLMVIVKVWVLPQTAHVTLVFPNVVMVFSFH
jgi:hypothetical protein